MSDGDKTKDKKWINKGDVTALKEKYRKEENENNDFTVNICWEWEGNTLVDTTQIKDGFMRGRPEIFDNNTLLWFYFCSIMLKLVVYQVVFNL
jgi:hypothetical protein